MEQLELQKSVHAMSREVRVFVLAVEWGSRYGLEICDEGHPRFA